MGVWLRERHRNYGSSLFFHKAKLGLPYLSSTKKGKNRKEPFLIWEPVFKELPWEYLKQVWLTIAEILPGWGREPCCLIVGLIDDKRRRKGREGGGSKEVLIFIFQLSPFF